MLFLFLTMHWINWFWFIIISNNKTWIPPKDTDSGITIAYTGDYIDQYILFWYYSMLFLVGSEMLPTTFLELMVCILLVFVGTLFIGLLIGEISSILSAYTRVEREKTEEFDMVNTVMINLKIDENVKTRIIEYYEELKKTNFIQSPEIYKILPLSLSDSIKHFQINTTIEKLNFINKLNQNQISKLIKNIQISFYLPEDVIIKQGNLKRIIILGTTNNTFYFIHEGLLEVIVEKKDFDYFNINDFDQFFEGK